MYLNVSRFYVMHVLLCGYRRKTVDKVFGVTE